MQREAKVTAYSQPQVLRNEMEGQNMTHGKTIRADISNVRVGESIIQSGKTHTKETTVFFCDIGEIGVKETIRDGDDGRLPDDVSVQGLVVDHFGFFDLKNVLISSNGTINVTVDEKSELVPVEA